MKYTTVSGMDKASLQKQPLQDNISIGECRFEEMVSSVMCCRARPGDLLEEKEQPARKKRKITKRVRIAEEENELFYRSFDEEDMKHTWMSDNDFAAIKQGNRETLVTILKAWGQMSQVDAREFCLRGLERHVEMFYTMRKRDIRKTAVQRVLLDQKLLRALGISDPEALSQVYGELSQRATRRAIELAYVDSLR